MVLLKIKSTLQRALNRSWLLQQASSRAGPTNPLKTYFYFYDLGVAFCYVETKLNRLLA